MIKNEDFKYEYIMGRNISSDPLFPLEMGYIFTHQYTLGEYFVTLDNIVEAFKSLLEKGDKIFYNNETHEILIKLSLPVNKEDIETIKTVLRYITVGSEINIENHYILIKIKDLLNIKKDV